MGALCPGRHTDDRQADPILCHDCQTWIAADLSWLEHTYPTLTDHLMPGQTGDNAHGVPGSRPPLRVDVLSASAAGGVAGVVGSWVQLVCEEREVDPPNYRLSVTAHTVALIRFLHVHHEWLMIQPFADEYGEEIRSLKYNLALLLGDVDRVWRTPIGRPNCPVTMEDGTTCGAKMREKIGELLIECRGGHIWEGMAEYERLGLMLGQDPMVSIDMAAALAKVDRRTVNRWILEGLLPVTETEDGRRVDKRDLAMIAARRAG